MTNTPDLPTEEELTDANKMRHAAFGMTMGDPGPTMMVTSRAADILAALYRTIGRAGVEALLKGDMVVVPKQQIHNDRIWDLEALQYGRPEGSWTAAYPFGLIAAAGKDV